MNMLKIKEKSIQKLREILINAEQNELSKSDISVIKNSIILKQGKNKKLLDNFQNSPYYNIASQYWERKGVYEPTYLHGLLAFGEFAKINHRINKNIKEK